MKSVPRRKYTEEFRAAAVEQVIVGRRELREVARSLEMSDKTLANWVAKPPGRQATDVRRSLELDGGLARSAAVMNRRIGCARVLRSVSGIEGCSGSRGYLFAHSLDTRAR